MCFVDGGPAMKSRIEQIANFLDTWSSDFAGRYEVLLRGGKRFVIQDCYLSRDQADRPDRVWVNYDSAGYTRMDFDPLEVVAIIDLEQQFEIIPTIGSNT